MGKKGNVSMWSDSRLTVMGERMTSNVIPNVAVMVGPDRWKIDGWDGDREFTRDEAIKAMSLLELRATGKDRDDPAVKSFESELGLR
jgi:hypothetical protein